MNVENGDWLAENLIGMILGGVRAKYFTNLLGI